MERIKKAFETQFKIVYVSNWLYPIQVEQTKYRENEYIIVPKSESMDLFCKSRAFKTRKQAFAYMRNCIKKWLAHKEQLKFAY